jgi:predicted aldo/keto reductase-like oxidoreductase
MLYRKVPKNGEELSILGFGCIRFHEKDDGSIEEGGLLSRYATQSTTASTI